MMHFSVASIPHLGRIYFLIPLLSLLVSWIPGSKRLSDKMCSWLVLVFTGIGWKLIFLHIYASLPFVQKRPFLFELISMISGAPLSTASYRLIGVTYTVIFSVMGLIFFGEGEADKKRQQLRWLNLTLLAILVLLDSMTWMTYGVGAIGAILMLYRLVAWPPDGPQALPNGQAYITGMGIFVIFLGGACSLSSLASYETISIFMGVGSLWGLYFLIQRVSIPISEPLSLLFYPYGCLLIPLLAFMKWGMAVAAQPWFIKAVTLGGGALIFYGGSAGFLSTTFVLWRQAFRWMGVGLIILVIGHYPDKASLTVLMSILCVDGLFSLYRYIFGEQGSPAMTSSVAKPVWIQKIVEGIKKFMFIGLFANALGLIPYGTGWGLWHVLWPSSIDALVGLSLPVLCGLFFMWTLLIVHGGLLLYTGRSMSTETSWGRLRFWQLMCLVNICSGLISTAYPWETAFTKTTLSLGAFILTLPYTPLYGMALVLNILGVTVYLTGFFWGWPFKRSIPFGIGRILVYWGRTQVEKLRSRLTALKEHAKVAVGKYGQAIEKNHKVIHHIGRALQLSEDTNHGVSAVSVYRYTFFGLGIILVIVLYWVYG